MKIVGITGTIGAGKGTIVDYLVENKGYQHYSVRAFVIDELKKRELLVDRKHMTDLANELREKFTPSYIVEQLYMKAKSVGQNCVLESIRTQGEVDALKQKGDFVLIAIDADTRIRYNRIEKRRSVTDMISYDQFIEDEEREMHSENPNHQNLSKCISLADYIINNDGTLEELHEQLEKKLSKLK